jgi:effector-binding domain-containing protein
VGRDKITYFTAVMHGDTFNFEDGSLDAEVGFLMPSLAGLNVEISKELVLKERLLPAVKDMASVVLVGGPSRYPAGFATVARWVEDNGYEVVGPQREIVLEIPPSGNENDMVIEVQFPVERMTVNTKQFISDSQGSKRELKL